MRVFVRADRWCIGLYVLFRYADNDRDAKGFAIKLPLRRGGLMFSERVGGWRSFRLGPLYIRSFQKKDPAP